MSAQSAGSKPLTTGFSASAIIPALRAAPISPPATKVLPTSVCAGDEDALHRGSQGRITPTLVTADAEIKLLTRAVRTVVSG